MLRIIQNSTSAGAKSYYSTADYYSEGQELTGVWRGKGAQRLGLAGNVGKEDWDALCDNINPRAGDSLTARQKDNRRVGYDFNFHVPKSVSILYGLTEDPRILDAFRAAMNATMSDMEAEMQARVRSAGRNEDRTTGNLIWGEFVHTTARPVDGLPDPHLHCHAFVFNATWDEEESRWKAGQFAGLKRDAPYFEALFHSRLARNLAEQGLEIRRSRRGWELAGFDAATLAKFSRRTREIEDKARARGITDPKRKAELGARTRKGKVKELTLPELQRTWRERLTSDESSAVATLAGRIGRDVIAEDPAGCKEAISRAIDHCFERSAVVPERTVLARALKDACGIARPEQVTAELAAQPLLKGQRRGRQCVTTREVLAEEEAMVRFAREGRGTLAPLAPGPHTFHREWLGDDQRKAVLHLLGSRDRVTMLRGGAGTGKTSLMQEVTEAIEAAGHKVFAFAPSAEASRGVLRQEGFKDADTVARLLLDEKLQDRVKGQVLWIDESGLLGARTTAQLFSLADRLDARLILSGDRRQHGSVERGSVLRLLEDEAGLVPAELREIQRQKGEYRRAVKALSEGRTRDGFRELDRLGWIREADHATRYRQLAADYVATVSEGKTALVVSPTHVEANWITSEIRSELKTLGKIARKDRTFTALVNANLTEAERRDPASYEPGDVLAFHQNARGHQKGDRVTVDGRALPLPEATRFQVFRPVRLELARGDLLRITRNGATADGKHRLNNGAVYTIGGFSPAGDIELTNGWTIGRNFGHIAYGYCDTSHASQGKTVDRVFIGQSSQSLPASSREQFYVSVSRGKQQAVIYTDDRAALLDAVDRSEDRTTATELLRQRHIVRQLAAEQQQTREVIRQPREREREHG